MKPVLAAAAFFLAFPAAAAPIIVPKKDAPKDTAAKLVGTWGVTKSPGELPIGTTVTFDKDLKFKVSVEFNGQRLDIEGTYKVEGDKLEVTVKGPDGKDDTDTDTIEALDDKKLVLVDKDRKEVELEKRSPAK